MARSRGIRTRARAAEPLESIVKPWRPSAGAGSMVISSIAAEGGASARSASWNLARSRGEPSARIRTPSGSFRTQPATPISRATR